MGYKVVATRWIYRTLFSCFLSFNNNDSSSLSSANVYKHQKKKKKDKTR